MPVRVLLRGGTVVCPMRRVPLVAWVGTPHPLFTFDLFVGSALSSNMTSNTTLVTSAIVSPLVASVSPVVVVALALGVGGGSCECLVRAVGLT